MGGDVVLCRLMSSQKRFAFRADQLRKHPFFK
jgi:hypothetical protein